MSNEFIGLPTAVGQQKIAAAIGGTALNPTVIRVGDGNGAPITPNTAMTDLVRRVGTAYPITASGRDPVNPTHWRFGAVIPAADGPFDIREIGLFDGAGDMLAISRHVLVEKRSPAQGAAVELYTEFVVPISETAQVAVTIQPTAAVTIFQLLSAGFCTIKSAQVAAPPGNPAIGDLYIVAAEPTGAWAGLTNRLVQWTGSVWVSIDPQPGFVVVAQDRALDHAERWLRRVVAGWESARAAEDALGLIELATWAEVQAMADAERAVTPAGLKGIAAISGPFRPYWLSVNSLANDPPVDPVAGATHVVGPAPTGAWAAQAGAIAQWTGAGWAFATVPAGHIVADTSKAENDPLRYLKFIGGVWISAAATVDAYGMTRLASDAEALAAVVDTVALTPKQALKRSNVPVLEAAIVAASPTVPSGVTTTLTTWTILNSEMAAGSSFVNGVFTCGAGDAGLYAVLAFGELNINGYQEGIVVQNNTTTIGAGSGYGGGSGSTYGAFNCSGGVRLAAGDTLRMQASQSSGSNASPTGAGRFYLVRIKAA